MTLSLPIPCWLCHQSLYFAHHGICCHCLLWLSRRKESHAPYCPQCGLHSSHRAIPSGRCLTNPPYFERLSFVSDYQLPLSHLVTQYKFQPKPQLASLLSRLLVLTWLEDKRHINVEYPVDLILCVPLHHHRYWQRGFNQSERLARKFAKILGLPYDAYALSKRRHTLAQHQLSATARQANLQNNFALHLDVTDLSIILIDDVVTTASTVNEISKVLKRAGAKNIHIVTLCRTL